MPRRQTSGSGWAWARVRNQVLERDGYLCQLRLSALCTQAATVVDHLVPVAHGGTDHLANLVAACPTCNDIKRVRETRR